MSVSVAQLFLKRVARQAGSFARLALAAGFASAVAGCAVPASRTLKPHPLPFAEWAPYQSGVSRPGYLDERIQILAKDPSKGVGLKDANDMGGGPAPVPSSARFRVFLLMGQSNMVGHGRASKLTPPHNQIHPRIRIWSRGQWQYLLPKHNFGPEVAFAHEMAEYFPNDIIGIIKIAVGGTGLNAWKPDWEWSEATKTGDALKGSLYRDMIRAVSAARRQSKFDLEGMLWKQGERDGRKAELSETYQHRFVEMVAFLREDLGAPDLPVFVLTYFDEEGLEEHRALLDKYRPHALPLFLFQAKVADFLPHSFPVLHGLLPRTIDQVHFDSEGQLILGSLAANAVKDYYRSVENAPPAAPEALGR